MARFVPQKPFAVCANTRGFRVPRCATACVHVSTLAGASECHPFKFGVLSPLLLTPRWRSPPRTTTQMQTAERALNKLVNAFECFIKQRDKINVIKNIIFVWISWHFILSGGGFAESLFALCKWFIIYGASLDRWHAIQKLYAKLFWTIGRAAQNDGKRWAGGLFQMGDRNKW